MKTAMEGPQDRGGDLKPTADANAAQMNQSHRDDDADGQLRLPPGWMPANNRRAPWRRPHGERQSRRSRTASPTETHSGTIDSDLKCILLLTWAGCLELGVGQAPAQGGDSADRPQNHDDKTRR
jgi:hypothetical protein